MNIADWRVGDSFTGFYLLKNIFLKTTAAGKPFLSAALADATGMIELKVWDYAGPISPADEGKVVKCQGSVQEFKGALQAKGDRIRLATEQDDFDITTLTPCAPMDGDSAYRRVEELIFSMEDDDYRNLCLEMLRRHGENFRKIPAAKTVHHGFVGGLLMHTVYMLETAEFLAKLYRPIVCRDLLLTGTLLHDFAKLEEFTVSQLGLVTGYSTKGQLLGHLVMGAQEVAEVAKELAMDEEKSVLVQHMLLSHHGQPEFGAAVVPQCAEAELLCCIDLIDSRMEIYQEAMDETPVGTFSKRIFALEKRIYHHG